MLFNVVVRLGKGDWALISYCRRDFIVTFKVTTLETFNIQSVDVHETDESVCFDQNTEYVPQSRSLLVNFSFFQKPPQ